MSERVILGIDPGTNKMGYGVISVKGRTASFVTMGYIDLAKFKTPYLKLGHIYERVSSLMNRYKPNAVALEAPFFGENVQSMLKLGRAQGVAIAAASVSCAEIFEYAPTKVKIAVTGTGSATKEQVADMLKHILNIKELPKNLDSTDGLAVALCHHLWECSPLKTSHKKGGWEEFISRNPDRVK